MKAFARIRTLTPLVALVLLAGILSSCTLFVPFSTPSPTAAPTATPAPTGTPTPVASPTPMAQKLLVFIPAGGVHVHVTNTSLTVNPVEILTGGPALTAAASDGVSLDTDFYLYDASASLASYTLTDDCVVLLLDPMGGADPTVVSDAAGIAAVVDEQASVPGSKGRLFQLYVDGPLCNRVEQFYIP